MADIFISYAREDIESAHALADVLVTRGWSVWWDRSIPPGKSFDEVIEEEIHAARCVVVLWSASSTDSRWVRTEATEAAERGILVPALMDVDARIPLAFKRIQAADLSDWRAGAEGHTGLDRLIAAVGSLLANGSAAPSTAAPPDQPGNHPGAVRDPGKGGTDALTVAQVLTDVLGSTAIAIGSIGVIGWFVGTLVRRQVDIGALAVWAVRANIWLFASMCAVSVLILFEGANAEPTAVGSFGRNNRRKLRWIAALSVAAAVAYPLYVILTGASAGP